MTAWQRRDIAARLKAAKVTTEARLLDDLARRIASSIDRFHALRIEPHASVRSTHDELHRLWELAHDERPRSDADARRHAAMLRTLTSKLSTAAVDYLNGRAREVLHRIIPGQSLPTGGFRIWVREASHAHLREALKGLIESGGKMVRGAYQPMIMGHIRGDTSTAPKGGRPTHGDQDVLVTLLALDWAFATRAKPHSGRSDGTPFGGLVHDVFSWLNEPGATQALRRYWAQTTMCDHSFGQQSD